MASQPRILRRPQVFSAAFQINLIGNCVATVLVAAWEKDIDLPLAKRTLDSDLIPDVAPIRAG